MEFSRLRISFERSSSCPLGGPQAGKRPVSHGLGVGRVRGREKPTEAGSSRGRSYVEAGRVRGSSPAGRGWVCLRVGEVGLEMCVYEGVCTQVGGEHPWSPGHHV